MWPSAIITLGVSLVLLIVSLISITICHQIFKKYRNYLRVLLKDAYVQESNSLRVLEGNSLNSSQQNSHQPTFQIYKYRTEELTQTVSNQTDEENSYESIEDKRDITKDNYESVADQTEVVVIQMSKVSTFSHEGVEAI